MGNQQSGAGGGGGKDKVCLNSQIFVQSWSCVLKIQVPYLIFMKIYFTGWQDWEEEVWTSRPHQGRQEEEEGQGKIIFGERLCFFCTQCAPVVQSIEKRSVSSTAKVPYFCLFANPPFLFRMSGFVMYFLVVNCPFTHSFIHQYCHATGVKALTQTGVEIRIDHLSTRFRILRSAQTYFQSPLFKTSSFCLPFGQCSGTGAGTGTTENAILCLSGTGTVIHSGSGTGFGQGSNIKCNTKVSKLKIRG